MTFFTRFLSVIGLLSLVAAAGMVVPGARPAMAQEIALAAEDVAAQAKTQIDDAKKRLETLRDQIGAGSADDAGLIDYKVRIDQMSSDLLKTTVSLRPRLNDITARLEALGAAPKDGQPAEAAAVAEERNRLTAERLNINTLTGEAETLSIAATQLSNAVTQIRRDLFAKQLFAHTEISNSVFSEGWTSLVAEFGNFQRTISSWLTFAWKYKPLSLGSAIMLSLAMALVLLAGEYRLFGSLIRRDPDKRDPSYMSRFSVAFWSTIIPSLALAAFQVSTYFFLSSLNVLRADIAPIVSATFSFVGLVVFVTLLGRAVFTPSAPHWRLVQVSNDGARNLTIATLLMAFINGLDYALGSISVAMGSPLVLTVLKSFVSSTIVGIIIIAISFLRPVMARDGDPETRGRAWPKAVALLLRIIGAGLVISSAAGYVGLSRFLATQIVVTGAVAVTVYIGIRSARAISAQNQFGETLVGTFLQKRFQLGPVALDQTGMLAGALIYLFALSIGIPLVLISWGFQPRDLQIWAVKLFTEISIGNVRISLFGILGGILLFAAGLTATHWFQKWLDRNVMARSQVDPGVRNSVKTGIGYLGTALAGLIGISAAGIDLSSLALVAGALSLGIGFGLQNIVSNFVSGLILLVERPFKVGDWVATGATEGFVRKISVRATEIETFQRQSIIVPNSELINASVGNWTHRNTLARVDVVIGVSYDSDPRRVMEILTEVARGQPGVLRNPDPFVIFLEFGNSSLDFQLCYFVADILNSLDTKNETRIRIFERFREENIEIPFPQQDVHVQWSAGGQGGPGKAGQGLGEKPDVAPQPDPSTGNQPPVEMGHLQDGDADDTIVGAS
ncbi:MAG: mechanosensitive ion channel family protein [Allorhizobium sp.]